MALSRAVFGDSRENLIGYPYTSDLGSPDTTISLITWTHDWEKWDLRDGLIALVLTREIEWYATHHTQLAAEPRLGVKCWVSPSRVTMMVSRCAWTRQSRSYRNYQFFFKFINGKIKFLPKKNILNLHDLWNLNYYKSSMRNNFIYRLRSFLFLIFFSILSRQLS